MIGEGNHPDLGVYLQPDPEHLVGARIFSGPQAYAYAGGRPLVNADPTGRIIEGFGETATLRNLPDGYGALVRYIDDDQRFVVKVISASSTDSDVVAHHGACTVNWGTEERRPGGSWCGVTHQRRRDDAGT